MRKVTPKPHLHRDWIHPNAIAIIRILQRARFATYLVGGCIRDLLCGIQPKDYDIVTLARPSQIKRLIKNAYVIGRRFRLVLVKRDGEQFEVATFRREVKPDEVTSQEKFAENNVFGSPEEDALRRDFTINSLFYDPLADELVDFCGGRDDIDKHIVRIIGVPDVRLGDDPIRILRALRMAHKLNFEIEPSLRASMVKNAHLLKTTPLPRRREEFIKILKLENLCSTLYEAHDLELLKYSLPTLHQLYNDSEMARDFNTYLSRIRELVSDNNNPSELFGIPVLGYYRLNINSDPYKSMEAEKILGHPKLGVLMRDELGLFNSEQIIMAKALEIGPFLKRIGDFKQRGQRRQNAFLRNPAFPLALMFARADLSLTPQEILFWDQAYFKLLDKSSRLK